MSRLMYIHLNTDGLENTANCLLAVMCSKWKRKVTYPNPLLPVAITVPGICACQCTSLTESM